LVQQPTNRREGLHLGFAAVDPKHGETLYSFELREESGLSNSSRTENRHHTWNSPSRVAHALVKLRELPPTPNELPQPTLKR
jgi:hypothetical protein